MLRAFGNRLRKWPVFSYLRSSFPNALKNLHRRPFLEQLESRLAMSSFYVAPAGNDGNDGSQQHPFETLQKGASVLNPGDTLNVEAGTYSVGIQCGYDSS